ncbi:MAG: intradiol ring-cleavage dioxygenase [Burkholderiaceae bacterium]|nr:intradiol ring-cleavage dioxygenase [Burkholderiaceae bacterium]
MKTPADAGHAGLTQDLDRLLQQQRASRRRALGWLAAGGLGASGLWLPGCGGGGDAGTVYTAGSGSSGSGSSSGGSGSGSGTGTGSGGSSSSCTLIPEETAGPYPGDGSNTANGSVANALALSGIVRSDIRSSIAGASGTADGVPMTVTLTLVNTNGSCATLEGFAIYLWHCDALGRYSMYSSGATSENYLRGVQETDANGQVSFTTIVPGCYSGRWPHMHFEVYRSLTTATSFSNKLRTSQLAVPKDVCDAVYALSGYTGSARNLASISLSSDNIFADDGAATQLAEVTGNSTDGYAATLEVGISV